jgi:hypothetical protein
MGPRTGIHKLWSAAIWLGLFLHLPSPDVRAAEGSPGEPSSVSATDQLEEELDEVLVDGRRPSRKASEIISWMRRLVGQFTYEGHVDLTGQGNSDDQRPVQGYGDCVPFGQAPAVQCEISVSWPEVRTDKDEQVPGGLHTLNPAIMLYGLDPYEPGIRFMLVDSRGIAEPALGLLIGDTLVSREPCASEFGNCQRVTRITAELDAKVVEMHIDIYFDYRRMFAYRFLLRRVPAPPTNVPVAPQ